MEILLTLAIGLFVGWIASLIMNRDAEQGVVGNIIVGIIGAFLGGILSKMITGQDLAAVAPLSLTNLFWAIIGAIIVSAIFNLITRKRVR